MLAPLGGFLALLWIGAIAVKLWALIDAAIRPAPAYVAADKQTKQLWVILLVLSVGLDLLWRPGNFISLFAVAGLIVAIVYLVDVRPRVKETQGGSSPGSGPYGPW